VTKFFGWGRETFWLLPSSHCIAAVACMQFTNFTCVVSEFNLYKGRFYSGVSYKTTMIKNRPYKRHHVTSDIYYSSSQDCGGSAQGPSLEICLQYKKKSSIPSQTTWLLLSALTLSCRKWWCIAAFTRIKKQEGPVGSKILNSQEGSKVCEEEEVHVTFCIL
jgi:hypothetical protein